MTLFDCIQTNWEFISFLYINQFKNNLLDIVTVINLFYTHNFQQEF